MPQSEVQAVFIHRLTQARKAMGMSQATLGREIGLSEEVASARINRYERGAFQPDLQTAEAMAKALGVPLAWLVCADPKLAAMIEAFAKLPHKAQDAFLDMVQSAAALTRDTPSKPSKKAKAGVPGEKARPTGNRAKPTTKAAAKPKPSRRRAP